LVSFDRCAVVENALVNGLVGAREVGESSGAGEVENEVEDVGKHVVVESGGHRDRCGEG